MAEYDQTIKPAEDYMTDSTDIGKLTSDQMGTDNPMMQQAATRGERLSALQGRQNTQGMIQNVRDQQYLKANDIAQQQAAINQSFVSNQQQADAQQAGIAATGNVQDDYAAQQQGYNLDTIQAQHQDTLDTMKADYGYNFDLNEQMAKINAAADEAQMSWSDRQNFNNMTSSLINTQLGGMTALMGSNKGLNQTMIDNWETVTNGYMDVAASLYGIDLA